MRELKKISKRHEQERKDENDLKDLEIQRSPNSWSGFLAAGGWRQSLEPLAEQSFRST